MITSRRGSFLTIVFLWQWRYTLLYLGTAAVVATLHELYGVRLIELPTLPLAVVGAALGIFVSFRTNSAYDRWWEGRKLWGRMINTSRHFATQVLAYLPRGEDGAPSETQRRLVLRHVAYVHALRCLLRDQDPFADAETMEHLDADHVALREESNLTHALLSRQLGELATLNDEGVFDAMRMASFDGSVRALLDIQGGCERIKKTPMPPIYGLLATRLVQAYSILFPMAVVHDLGWNTVPINLLVCTAFSVIAEAGRVLEDPFTMFFNGLPLSAISRMIEVNLRQRLGDENLPPMRRPDPRGILM